MAQLFTEIKMNCRNYYILILLIFTVSIFFTCASKPEHYAVPSIESEKSREEKILNLYTDQKNEKYADMLVPLDRYTTKGSVYHQKYHRHLISIAGDIVENKRMMVASGSIGFYFDKKLNDREHLYLGLDIDTAENTPEGYQTAAMRFIRRDLKKLMQTVNSCRTIFYEDAIIGMVIGWKWRSAGSREFVNIWISKGDVISYENSRLTFDELIQRGTITNTDGKIIRLAL